MTPTLYRLKDKRGRPRGSWLFRYTDPKTGTRVPVSTGTKVYKDAVIEMHKRLGAVADGKAPPVSGRKLTFNMAAEELLQNYRNNNRSSTPDVQARIDLHLRPFFGGDRLLTSIETPDVNAFITYRLQQGGGLHEVNNELRNLRRLFRLQWFAERIAKYPRFALIDDEGTARQGFFEDHELADAHEHAPSWLRGPMLMAFVSGWRMQSEVMPIEWRRVDLRAGTVRLDPGTTKNKRGRLFPFGSHAELVEVFETQAAIAQSLVLAGGTCPYVFHDGTGAPLFRIGRRGKEGGTRVLVTRQVRTAWAAMCKASAVKRIAHDFRRTAVRNYVDAGNSEKVAMELSGHQTRTVFDRYHIVNKASLSRAVARLPERTR